MLLSSLCIIDVSRAALSPLTATPSPSIQVVVQSALQPPIGSRRGSHPLQRLHQSAFVGIDLCQAFDSCTALGVLCH